MLTKIASIPPLPGQLDRSALALAVVNEGDLPAAGMLLDDLDHKGDPRSVKLSWLLSRLVTATAAAAARIAATGARSRPRYDSPEEAAHRANEYHFQAWRGFADEFERLFWVEIHGNPDLQALKAAAGALESNKQAQRLARDRSDPEGGGPVDPGENSTGRMAEQGW